MAPCPPDPFRLRSPATFALGAGSAFLLAVALCHGAAPKPSGGRPVFVPVPVVPRSKPIAPRPKPNSSKAAAPRAKTKLKSASVGSKPASVGSKAAASAPVIGPTLALDMIPDPFTPSVKVYLQSGLPQPQTVRVTLSNGENFLGAPHRVQTAALPPGGRVMVRFPLPGAAMAPDSRYAFTAEAEVTPPVTPPPATPPAAAAPSPASPATDAASPASPARVGAASITTRVRTTRLLSFFRMERTFAKPAMDGTMSGWLNASMILVNIPGRPPGSTQGWGGSADKTATARFQWDPQFLYLMVRCTDNVTRPAPSPADPNGDRVRLALSPTASHLPGAPWVEVDLIPLQSGALAVTRTASPSLKLAAGPLSGVVSAFTRINDVEVYTAALPWAALGLPQGKVTVPLGLTVRALDDDGGGIKSWLEWGGGAGLPADPPSFSDVSLGQ